MRNLPALAVAIPLAAAALLAGLRPIARRRLVDVIAVSAALAVTVICAVLLVDTGRGTVVSFVGGFGPRPGPPLGIALAVDPVGAGLAGFAALTVVAALLLSSAYLDEVTPFFHALMLVFLAAMVGFALTGDLFNLFVFFELMSVAAYALTGYRVERSPPLQGALGFVVLNSLGGFMIVGGIGLLYGRTGTLNLAQVGQALAGHPPDGLVVVAFGLLATGFFTKAAVVPFHFWLADAYAVALAPACLVFSAAMSELGLYAVARLWFTVFEPALGGGLGGVQAILLTLGTVTAIVGGIMCFAQDLLKRLLAFATIGHVGLFLLGLALLEPSALAGMGLLIVADGFVKAALFVCVAVLEHRRERATESELHGLGRGLWVTGALFAGCGLVFASLPPFGPFLGKALVDGAAHGAGLEWVPWVMVATSALTGGAVLRVAGRVFLGWGGERRRHGELADVGAPQSSADDELETASTRRWPSTVMVVTALSLAAAGLAVGLVPGVSTAFVEAARRFVDRPGYVAAVLHGAHVPVAPARGASPSVTDFAHGVATTLLALALASGALWHARLPGALARIPGLAEGAMRALRALHSGRIGDYVAWLTVGAALLGGALAVTFAP